LANLNNSYAGGTTVAGGILSVADDWNLDDLTGEIRLNTGELLTTGNAFCRSGRLT
jgi:hypothetical protein